MIVAKMLFRLSRPRFWLYLGGTYMVGFLLAASSPFAAFSVLFFAHFLYFLLPANLFLYGVNDFYDVDTDAFNKKKGTKELRIASRQRFSVFLAIVTSALLALPLIFGFYSLLALAVWFAFFFLSFFYSAPPIRFKAHPFVDSISNVLYVLPGVLAYVQLTGTFPPLKFFLAAWAWVAAMHLFSAVPDIVADRKAALSTTAVLLGHDWSLVLCGLLWSATFFLTFSALSWWGVLLVLYPLIAFGVLFVKELPVDKVYWWFPYINALMGFLLFLYAVV